MAYILFIIPILNISNIPDWHCIHTVYTHYTIDSVVAVFEHGRIHLTIEINRLALASAADTDGIVVGYVIKAVISTVDIHTAVVNNVNQTVTVDIGDIGIGIASSVAPTLAGSNDSSRSLPTIVVGAGFGVQKTVNTANLYRFIKGIAAWNLRTASQDIIKNILI